MSNMKGTCAATLRREDRMERDMPSPTIPTPVTDAMRLCKAQKSNNNNNTHRAHKFPPLTTRAYRNKVHIKQCTT